MGAISMFVRDVHRTVLAVLQVFRADVLRRCPFLFGGGPGEWY